MAIIYLVRHGEAEGGSSDQDRVLTAEGAAAVERLAAWAARVKISVTEISHSGKRRAEETAAIFARHLKPRRGVTIMPEIGPEGDPALFAEEIAAEAEPAMFVSHLPFLGNAVAELVGSEWPVVNFHPATLVALARDDERFAVEFVVHPALV